MTTKVCFKCLCEKPLEAFYKHNRMADGHLNKCKECTKSDVTKRRAENADYVRAYDRSRSNLPHRVKARNAYQKTEAWAKSHSAAAIRWAEKHPDRRAASLAVGNAVRDGRLSRQPCWCCGEKAQAHHPDYSRPLDVVWLCPTHHKQAHAVAKNI